MIDQAPPISAAVGTTIVQSQVVALQCIPSRADPVGVFINIHIVDARLGRDTFELSLASSDTRLGSHPSGCSRPAVELPQSVFLLDGNDETLLASAARSSGGVTTLEFDLAGRDPAAYAAVVLPTVSYAAGDGVRGTASYGLAAMFILR